MAPTILPLDQYSMITPEDARLKNEYSIFTYKGDYSSEGWNGMGPTMPQDAQIDFQVKAYIRYIKWVETGMGGGYAFKEKKATGATPKQ